MRRKRKKVGEGEKKRVERRGRRRKQRKKRRKAKEEKKRRRRKHGLFQGFKDIHSNFRLGMGRSCKMLMVESMQSFFQLT